MPMQFIQYQCVKCFQTYLNEQTAIDCENSHYTLDDFKISRMSKEKTPFSCFPRSIHVINQKTNTTASYLFNHNKVKSVKHRWLDSLDETYKKGYRFDSGLFPSEEEDG